MSDFEEWLDKSGNWRNLPVGETTIDRLECDLDTSPKNSLLCDGEFDLHRELGGRFDLASTVAVKWVKSKKHCDSSH